MTTTNHVGEHIRLFRLQKGMSQEQLALSAQMNTSYLGQLERGTKNPTLPTLEKIARGLNITIEEIISGTTQNETALVHHQQYLTLLTKEDIKKIVVEAINENCKSAIHFNKK